MALTRRFRASARVMTVALLASLVGACATRSAPTLAPAATVSANIVWRVEEGDIIKTRVYRQPDLASEPIVNSRGTAFFPGLGRVQVAGLTIDSLEALLNARYSALIREPAVQVTMNRELVLYGQVRLPGVYSVDPGTTLVGLLARAGGPNNPGNEQGITLETTGGRRLALPREARLGGIDIKRTDAIKIEELNFFLKNSGSLQAASVLFATISTLLGVILVVSR
ncbi:MAG: polysaccharide biosynthesis/export family protein [Gemmatimonadota bacterium]|nr:polysaccharide biosynthesis/export family protein [Gemmatimonadota bacterium]